MPLMNEHHEESDNRIGFIVLNVHPRVEQNGGMKIKKKKNSYDSQPINIVTACCLFNFYVLCH